MTDSKTDPSKAKRKAKAKPPKANNVEPNKSESSKSQATQADRKTSQVNPNTAQLNAKATQSNPQTTQASPKASGANKNMSKSNQAPSTQDTNSVTNKTDDKKGGGKGLSIFAILLSLLALAGSGFTWYQNEVLSVKSDSSLAVGVSEIGGQVSRLGDAINVLKQQQGDVVSQSQLSTRLLEADVKVNKQLQTVLSEQAEMQAAVEKVSSDLQSGVNDFVLDEVSQLLKLANYSALFAGDAESSINALSLADIHLKDLAEPRFSVVRKAINGEIASLLAVEMPDIEKLSAQLSAMTGQVPSLPLANEPPAVETVVLTETEKADAPLNWRSELRKIWHDMINAVSIQRVDQPPKPLLAPEQRYFLDQNLILNLNKAELALLQKQNGVYKQSLESSEQWLREYFDTRNAKVETMLKQLAALKAEKVSVELPVISKSYDALQSITGGQ